MYTSKENGLSNDLFEHIAKDPLLYSVAKDIDTLCDSSSQKTNLSEFHNFYL